MGMSFEEIISYTLDFAREKIRIPKRKLSAKERGMAIEQREKVLLNLFFFKVTRGYDVRVGGFAVTEWEYWKRVGISNTSGGSGSSKSKLTRSDWHPTHYRTINYNREGRLMR